MYSYMFQPDRAIFRELCTVKSNLKTNAVFIKYYGHTTNNRIKRLLNDYDITFSLFYETTLTIIFYKYRICFKIRFYCTLLPEDGPIGLKYVGLLMNVY
jgi:hypothetical protein